MTEKTLQFFGFMIPVINDAESSLQNKIEIIASKYMDLLSENPDLPFFILNEIKNNPAYFIQITGRGDFLSKSVLIRQIREKVPGQNPFHYFINLLGLCVFPFVMNPVLQKMGAIDEKTFIKMMKDRKAMIPVWMKSMLEAD
jgi:hypothetical protein